MEKPLQVFCCYARTDQSYLLELKKRLLPLQRDGLIAINADINISPGEDWEQQIHYYLNTAHIILLLISADFIASDYCYSKEMIRALERHNSGDTWVIPIILRPVDLRRVPFGNIQSLPTDAKPITKWGDQDDAFLDVMNGIEEIVRNLINTGKALPVPPSDDPDLVPNSLKSLGYMGRKFNQTGVIIPPLCLVPAGPATLGAGADATLESSYHCIPQRRAYLGDFHISKYPVTVAEYNCAVRAQAIPQPNSYAGIRFITWRDQLSRPDYPVIMIFFHEAQAYANWLAKITNQPWRLSSEDEWEKAARGTDGRIYPWGNSWDLSRANTANSRSDSNESEYYHGEDGGRGDLTKVGSYPTGASPYGIQDMAGNVWEWTNSIAEEIDSQKWRVLRGGSWSFGSGAAKTFYRLSGAMPYPLLDAGMGFRLAYG